MPQAHITTRTLAALKPGHYLREDMLVARKAQNGRVTFAIRIQGPDPFYSRLTATVPPLTLADVRAEANTVLARRQLGQSAQPADKGLTIRKAWEADEGYRAWLRRRGKSTATIASYEAALARLDDKVAARTPLRTLSERPGLFTAEYDRIAHVEPGDGKRAFGHGRVAARSAGRFVRAVYRHAARRLDPSLPTRLPTIDCDLSNLPDTDTVRPLPAMAAEDLPRWWRAVKQFDTVRRECALFGLLSGLRRTSLFEMKWSDRIAPFAFHIPQPKYGTAKAFDLLLSREMHACLGRVLAHCHAVLDEGEPFRWVWPRTTTRSGHVTSLRTMPMPMHALRRTYTSMSLEAVAEPDLVRRLLNHRAHGSIAVTVGYARTSAIGRLLIETQQRISDAIVSAIGDESLRVEPEDTDDAATLAAWDADFRPWPR
jgi:hypothetical protein